VMIAGAPACSPARLSFNRRLGHHFDASIGDAPM
jgi:hypothetical protein